MGVFPATQPDHTSQTGTPYKTALDDVAAGARRIALWFYSEEQSTPDMTVKLNAGWITGVQGSVPTEVATQNTGIITAPSTNPRKDIVHVDNQTGTIAVTTGTEAASPVDPTVPNGKIPVARVNLVVSQTEIVNVDLDDLRPISGELAHLMVGDGLVRSGANLDLDINALTTAADPVPSADFIPYHDAGVGNRKALLTDIFKRINQLVDITTALNMTADSLLVGDATGPSAKKIIPRAVLDGIDTLTNLAAGLNMTADNMIIVDASDGIAKRIQPRNILDQIDTLADLGTGVDKVNDKLVVVDATDGVAKFINPEDMGSTITTVKAASASDVALATQASGGSEVISFGAQIIPTLGFLRVTLVRAAFNETEGNTADAAFALQIGAKVWAVGDDSAGTLVYIPSVRINASVTGLLVTNGMYGTSTSHRLLSFTFSIEGSSFSTGSQTPRVFMGDNVNSVIGEVTLKGTTRVTYWLLEIIDLS